MAVCSNLDGELIDEGTDVRLRVVELFEVRIEPVGKPAVLKSRTFDQLVEQLLGPLDQVGRTEPRVHLVEENQPAGNEKDANFSEARFSVRDKFGYFIAWHFLASKSRLGLLGAKKPAGLQLKEK